MAEGKWRGDGWALVADCWSLLLLGPWQPCTVLVFRGQEDEREREMGAGTHLVVLISGDSGVATSTYTVTRVSAADLVMWLCHVVVIVRRCTHCWGQLNDVRQWLLEVEVKQVASCVDGGGGQYFSLLHLFLLESYWIC